MLTPPSRVELNRNNIMSFRIPKKYYYGETMFMTITTIEWIDVFTKEKYFKVLLDSLEYCQKEKGLLIFGFVFMTSHIHLIVSCKTGNLADIIRDFKSYTTSKIKKLLINDRRQYILRLLNASCYKKVRTKFQIWQRENYPEVIRSDNFFEQKLKYIHYNPVKKGYVKNPEDWKYSSAKNYYLNDNSLIKIVNWR